MGVLLLSINLWVVSSLLVAVYAERRGRSFGIYFFISLAISPVIGFLIVAFAATKRGGPAQTVAPASGDGMKKSRRWKAAWGLGLLTGVLSAFLGRIIGEHIGHPSAFDVAHGLNFGRIAGGIYGALFGSIAAGLAALRYRWLALLIGLAVGSMGAVLGAYLETH